MPFKSEAQRRYLWANEPEIARDWTDTYGSRIQAANGGIMDVAIQGGVDNYLGKQPQVQAPRKWQSGPDKPPTELAYITEAEKDLILKTNMHGGLEGGPNIGPSGIISLDSFGDVGGAGASGGDTSAGGGANQGAGFSGQGPGQSDRDFDRQKLNQRAALQIAERQQAQNLGYNERENIAEATYGPLQKHTGERGFLGNLFRGANKYGYTDTYTSGPNQGQVKPGWGGRILGGLAGLATGVPFVGGAIGNAIDKGKGIFGRKPRDMSQYNQLGLYDDRTKQKAFYDDALLSDSYSDMKISDTSFEQNLPENIKALNTYNDMIPGLETKFVNQDQPGPWNNFTPGGITNIDINEETIDDSYNDIAGHMADISQPDIDAYLKNTMVEYMDDDTAAETIKMETGNTTLNAGDIRTIKKYKEKTKPTGIYS